MRKAFVPVLYLLLVSCGKPDAPPPRPAPPAPPPAPLGSPVQSTTSAVEPTSLKRWEPPATMPEPVERIPGEQWSSRWEEAKKRINLKSIEGDSQPAFSLLIFQVVSGFPAARAGVKVDDRIVRVEGKPVKGYLAFSRMREEGASRLELWSPERGPYFIQAKESRLGIQLRPLWHPEIGYVQSKDRDARWDELVVAAAYWYAADSDFAETALFHAARAGYKGWLLPALMTVLAKEDGRPLESMNYGWFAKEVVPEDQRQFVLSAFFMAAVHAGQHERAFKMSEEWDKEFPVVRKGFKAEDHLARLKSMGDEERNEPSPCTIAASAARPLQPLEALDRNSKHLIEKLASDKRARFDLAPPDDIKFIIGPGARNTHFLLELDLDAFEPRLQGHEPLLECSLVGISQGLEEDVVELFMRPGQVAQIRDQQGTVYDFYGSRMTVKGKNRIEIAARGRQCEVRLNGRCLFLTTVDDASDRKLVFFTQLWNVRGAFTRFEVVHLDAPASTIVAAPKPAASRPADVLVPPKPADPALGWYHRALLDGYLAHGKRNPAWDQPVVDALSMFLRFFRDSESMTDVGEIFEKTAAAVAAGCDDPLLLFAHARAGEKVKLRKVQADRLVRQAAGELLNSTAYSPALRCHILALAGGCGSPQMDANKKAQDALTEAALALLVEALDEEGVPGQVQAGTLILLAHNHPLALREKNHEAGFEKVWDRGEKGKHGKAPLLALKGEFFIKHAWRARGNGFANTVSEEGWKIFGHRLKIAAAAFEESWKLDPKNPLVPAMMITVALGDEATRKNLPAWIERSLAAYPSNRDAADKWLYFLAPKWHGSREEILEAGRSLFDRAKRDSLDPSMALVLLKARSETIQAGATFGADPSEEWAYAQAYWRSEEGWKEIEEVFEWILARHPKSSYYRSLYALWACVSQRWTVAKRQFDLLGDRLVRSVFTAEFNADEMLLEAARKAK